MQNFTPSPGTGDLYVDPYYVDPINGNFSLNSSSQLIGAGQYGYDMGAVPYTVRPLMPTDLQIATTPNEFDVTLSWVNPTQNTDGSVLTSLSGVLIYRNDEIAADLSGMVPGAPVQYTDTVPVQGDYRYRILAYTDVEGLHAFTREQWIGPPDWAAPTGPDAYGYLAFESVDPGGPVFDWIEIDPGMGGSGSLLNFTQDDQTFQVNLPFPFKYYGLEFELISVCSNGWLAMGPTDETDYSNSAIPNADGPPAMLAPFWEDLSPQQSGSVSYCYDWVNHWFTVEFYRVRQCLPETAFETFQVILYDPAHHPTATGDGKILFQWLDVTDPTQATFGIENQAEAVGLQLGLDNAFAGSFLGVQDGHAVLFLPPAESFPIAVTLTPETWPIIIPPAGGSFDYTIELSAPTSVQTFDVWIDAVLPNGSVYGPVIARTVTQQAGQSLSRDMTQNVPGGAPAGSYLYRAMIGDQDLGVVWSLDSFEFSKSGVVQGSAGSWACVETARGDETTREEDAGALLLCSNTPNPFNPLTTLRFSLSEAARVHLEVYNMQGQKLGTLVEGWRDAGVHEVTFDGSGLASGMYLYRLQVGELISTGKMILLK